MGTSFRSIIYTSEEDLSTSTVRSKNLGHLLGEVCIYNRSVNQGDFNMDKSDKTHQIISVLMKDARHCMDHASMGQLF